jgi:predicted CXXCH cytochrome family protein
MHSLSDRTDYCILAEAEKSRQSGARLIRRCQQMYKQSFCRVLSLPACIAIIASFVVIGIAQDRKEIPDHAGFQSCQSCHAEKYSMWETSGHSKALSRIANNSRATADCFGCHSAEGFAAKRQGKKLDIGMKEGFHSLSCTTCHDPGSKINPHQLVMDPEKICNSCHAQEAVLQGTGGKGLDDIRSFHSAVPCVSCHMTESNHLMKVIRPDDPDLSEKRVDTCTACHQDNNRKARAEQIQDWQATYKEHMDPLQADLKDIDAGLKEKPDRLNAELKTKLNNVRFNLSVLERDRSRGVHNHDFAMEVMIQSARGISEVKAAMK